MRQFRPIVLLAAAGLLLQALPAGAHPDPDPGPATTLTGAVTTVTLVPAAAGATSLNPEWGNENYAMFTVWRHGDNPGEDYHGIKEVASSGDYDTTTGLTLPFHSGTGLNGAQFNNITASPAGLLANGTNDYTHDECLTRESLMADINLYELDGGAVEAALIGIAGLVVGGGIALIPETAGGSFLAGLGVGAVFLIVGTIVGLDGDDHLGGGTITFPTTGSGTFTQRITPPRGSSSGESSINGANVTVTYSNAPSSAVSCTAAGTNSQQSSLQLFDRIDSARQVALAQVHDEGTPNQAQTRTRAAARDVVDLGGLVAGMVVHNAAPFAGAAEAVETYEGALALLAEGLEDEALAGFRDATEAALAAIAGGEEAPEAYAAPQTVVGTSVLVVDTADRVTTAGMLVGDVEAVEVRADGLPDGITFTGVPGLGLEGVALSADLDGDLTRFATVGLGNWTGHTIVPADEDCPHRHVVAEGDVTVDGVGTFSQPDDPCGFGRVVVVGGHLPDGAVPDDAAGSLLRLTFDVDGAQPGTYPVQVVASDGETEWSTPVTITVVPDPDDYDPTSKRLAGDDRIATALELSRTFPAGVDTVHVATANDFPDALAAGPATFGEGPVVLVGDDLRDDVTAELRRLSPQRVVVAGGPVAVSDDVVDAIADALGDDVDVDRVSGDDRVATSLALSQDAFPDGAPFAIVATAANFPDALAAGAWAGRRGGAVLLTAATVLDERTAAELQRLDPDHVVVVGGPAALPEEVVRAVALALPDADVDRVSGPDRLATAGAVADAAMIGASTALVATGANFPDALAAVPVAIANRAPLVLTDDDPPTELRDLLAELGVEELSVVGGEVAVPPSAVAALTR